MLKRQKIEERIKKFRQIMQSEKLPITPQKLSIFQFIASIDTHPTAQEIYKKMQYYFENIAFATVYKNLKKFENLNLIRLVEIRDNTARYDANMESHHHLINIETNEITDIEADQIPAIKLPNAFTQYDLESVSINFFVHSKHQNRYEQYQAQKQALD